MEANPTQTSLVAPKAEVEPACYQMTAPNSCAREKRFAGQSRSRRIGSFLITPPLRADLDRSNEPEIEDFRFSKCKVALLPHKAEGTDEVPGKFSHLLLVECHRI